MSVINDQLLIKDAAFIDLIIENRSTAHKMYNNIIEFTSFMQWEKEQSAGLNMLQLLLTVTNLKVANCITRYFYEC